MPKRFTETTKWEDPWYRKLSSKHKSLWHYICDKCDNAGVWKIDYEMASFYLREDVGPKDLDAINGGKKRVLVEKQYLIVVDFIPFQIGNLKNKNLTNLQKNCSNLLNSYNQKGLEFVKHLHVTFNKTTCKLKVKGKVKGKVKVKKEKELINNQNKDFISIIKNNKAYTGINIDREIGKMEVWLSLHPGRKLTKKFVVNWLNKIDTPITIPKKTSIKEPEAKIVRPDYSPEGQKKVRDLINGIGKEVKFERD